ncbi:hypothetical protein B0H19DRAFT_1104459 [Mycena capillaripes]|nr:hypothetical protein B0H19DRAFT_1104459 [Mycena capillaripes]
MHFQFSAYTRARQFATSRQECDDANFRFEFSGKTGNHWSNQKTMRERPYLVCLLHRRRF